MQARLDNHTQAWAVLRRMEQSGGEPDVVGGVQDGQISFFDCSAESPAGRRSLCFDEAALAATLRSGRLGGAALDARGGWRLRGEIITHPGLLAFLDAHAGA